jgi:hypothetical protein
MKAILPAMLALALGAAPAAMAGFTQQLQFGTSGTIPVAWGDYDNDGDADLLITNLNRQPTLLRNDGTAQFPTLRLTLIGRTSNRSAYGARIRVLSGGITQLMELRGTEGYMASNDTRVLVHLPGGVADEVEITWPGGGSTLLRDQLPAWLVIDEAHGVIARR